MPFAKFVKVREVSSEDDVHLAENLLQQQPGKKWKTKTPGEKSAYVVLELSEPQQITGIDIGNEHSAFVEVMVGKGNCTPDNFTEILLTYSLMTPPESKSSSNPNRVRCFNRDALVPTAANGKWQLVKIICTQPFNKHVQYGISFIKVHVADSKSGRREVESPTPGTFVASKTSGQSKHNVDDTRTPAKPHLHFGRFVVRDESPDSESEETSTLFNRWKASKASGIADTLTSPAAVIREASKSPAILCRLNDSAQKPKLVISNKTKNDMRATFPVQDRNRDEVLFGKDEEEDVGTRSLRLEKCIESEKKQLRTELQNRSKNGRNVSASRQEEEKVGRHSTISTDKKNQSTNLSANSKESGQDSTLSSVQTNKGHHDREGKRTISPLTKPSKKVKSSTEVVYRPFNKLLENVVLVISGIQNPDRAELRAKAIKMGAKYKSDWDSNCTHLVCAFKNTPKYNQVRGKGKIVTRSWIEKCYAEKKYLPWRRFALDSADLSLPESDIELLDERLETKTVDSSDSVQLTLQNSFENDLVPYDVGIATKNTENESISQLKCDVTSDSDTDDEILRVQQENDILRNKNSILKPLEKIQHQNVYEATTDEEDYLEEKLKQNKFK